MFMNIKMMFEGQLWILPVFIGLVILLWGLFLGLFSKRRNWTRDKRIHYLRLGRSIIPVLPMSGIFGTVWGLMDTLLVIGRSSVKNLDMNVVAGKFAVALNTTFWGIVFAFLSILVFEIQLNQLEAIDEIAEQ